MNPPYKTNLHLEIARKAINHVEEKVINLSPCEWILDGYAKYKKNSDIVVFSDILEKTTDFLNVGKGSSYFEDLTYDINLAIYTLSHKGGFSFENLINDDILDKAVTFALNTDSLERNMTKETEGNVIYVSRIYGGSWRNGGIIKSYGYQFTSEKKKSEFKTGNNGSIPFNTEQEAINFSESARTKFYSYLMYRHKSSIRWNLRYLPFMGRVKRDHWYDDGKRIDEQVIGYARPWTDRDFYDFFKLDSREISIVESIN